MIVFINPPLELWIVSYLRANDTHAGRYEVFKNERAAREYAARVVSNVGARLAVYRMKG